MTSVWDGDRGQTVPRVHGGRDATTLADASRCFPRAPAYDEDKLPLATPGLDTLEEEMSYE